jgi:hypothetical protein
MAADLLSKNALDAGVCRFLVELRHAASPKRSGPDRFCDARSSPEETCSSPRARSWSIFRCLPPSTRPPPQRCRASVTVLYLPREVFFGRLDFAGVFVPVCASDFGRFFPATSGSFRLMCSRWDTSDRGSGPSSGQKKAVAGGVDLVCSCGKGGALAVWRNCDTSLESASFSYTRARGPSHLSPPGRPVASVVVRLRVGASPLGSRSASDWARLTKPSGSQESTLLRSGRMGRGSMSKRRWRKDRKRRKLAREKRKHVLQSSKHGRG